ncbi:hypothetical protein BAE44_0008350 [Dichanthelium oligosanthes]|uniref:NAC domain-containing protein n=1 Tax=Dichanthelium oligosanthes TaxID=888268 RepID=A0A1E5VZS8_9POAL|nr:hypothetical protein BAE44_0008350 [Dichanthelium oligosanthes]
MEAACRFGFDLPPANKFNPTDLDIVAYYLLPRAIGFPNPYEHAIINGDPFSCPPWEFMRHHGHADSDYAFFFGPPRVSDPNKRVSRAVAAGKDGVGGVWDGQKSHAIPLVLTRGDGPGAPELAIKFRRHNLSYYHGPQKEKTSGWVMNDYQIVEPKHLSATVLYRIKITDREKKKQGKGKQQDPPDPDQPGPSNYYAHGEPVGGQAGDENGVVMGDTGAHYVDGGNGYLYEGYGDGFCQDDNGGGGGCFIAGDSGGNDANGVVMGETGGYYVDGRNNFLNQDSGYYSAHGDGRGGGDYCFNGGDNNSYGHPYGGNGRSSNAS